jgi:hypothetical protein
MSGNATNQACETRPPNKREVILNPSPQDGSYWLKHLAGGDEIMGTAQEWFRVFVSGALFAMFLWLLVSRPRFVQPPRFYWPLRILYYVIAGFGFGIVDAFTVQAFRPPLVFLTIGIFACALPVGWSLRRFDRTLPRLPKKRKPAPFPVPDFSRIEKKPDPNDMS